jgi:hypothetical protein
MRRIFILTFSSFLSISLFSQSDFRPGYFITNSNDTVSGLIDYRGDIANSKSCSYKRDANSETHEFLPSTIKAFRFTDSKFYITKILPNDSSRRLVFMEYLLNGKTSVYYLKTHEKERYFIEKNGIMTEMNNDENIVKNQYDDSYSKASNQYKGVLKYYFQDAPGIMNSIDYVNFDKKSLIRISKKYHEKICTDESCIIYAKKSIKPIIHFGFFAEAGLHQCDFQFPSTFNFKTNPTLVITGGALIQSSLPFINENFYGQLSVGYGKVSIDKKKDPNYEYIAKNSFITGNLDFIYKFSFNKIKANVMSGFCFQSFTSSDYYYFYNYFGSSLLFKIDPSYYAKMSIGFRAGLGLDLPISKHVYNLSLRYEMNHANAGVNTFMINKGIILSSAFLF